MLALLDGQETPGAATKPAFQWAQATVRQDTHHGLSFPLTQDDLASLPPYSCPNVLFSLREEATERIENQELSPVPFL